MTYKKGDRFLVEVEYVTGMSDRDMHIINVSNTGRLCVSGVDLDNAQKIEPEYEEGEYYWVKINSSSKDWDAVRLYEDGKFWDGNHSFSLEHYYEIGPKCERPEE